ncbi:MAG TPA: nuclear transport factor 2 family protein, partial [Pseudomonadaceae bacterium]|nr:nuclear transport factor 2 family protein [Pseudomonadaceae bacterium]
MKRWLTTVFAALLPLLLPTGLHADAELDALARDLDRNKSIRAVKLLQNSYAQYAQYGLWTAVGDLFAGDGRFVFDGLVLPAETATGPAAIADFLRSRYGGGLEGLRADGLSSMFIEAPIVNLSPDGENAKGRWQVMIFHGHEGEARIEGGVFNVDYEREAGVWKIANMQYYPQYDGPYAVGWTNWGGGDLPVPPRHYTAESAGVPIPPATGEAPPSAASLAELQAGIDTLNESDRILNLQSAYGYYYDRKMWDDVVELFAEDGVVEIGGMGQWQGKEGVRHWLESIGPAGLSHGQLNDQLQNNVIVSIAPGGNEAFARGIELGMLGEADQELGWWQVTTFRNRFVKEDGVWKLRELRRFPLMKTDIFLGWGESRLVDPIPTGAHAPDTPSPAADTAAPGLAMPAFLDVHPVTGEEITSAGELRMVATSNL